MAEHEMGSMDTSTQEQAFDGFIKVCIRSVIAIILVLVFMALVNA